MDLVGMGSYLMFFLGEVSDIGFAPIQAAWIYFAYGSTKGALIGGIEELVPFTDIIPTCTIMHFLPYFIYTDDKGYKRFKFTDKLVHRAVAENKIGEKISKNDVVHHIDEDKGNFLKENLRVMSRKAHSLLHAKLRKKK